MSKYQPLERFLTGLDVQHWRVTFAEIEAILGFSLPKSAYHYPAWWANDATGHSHARAWLDAGWKTENVDIAGRKVTLVREADQAARERIGCMKGTFWVDPELDLTEPLGEPVLAEQGILHSE